MGNDIRKNMGETIWLIFTIGGLPNEVLHAFSAAPIFQYLT